MTNTNLKFKDIPKGEAILFNGNYAIKAGSNRLNVIILGVEGFIEMDEETELQVIEDENV